MTYLELIHEYFPGVSVETADELLWECTSYPCGDTTDVRKCLADMKERSDGDPGKAFRLAREDADKLLKNYPLRHHD